MRILANGNVGIGTDTPATPLEISRPTDGVHLRLTKTGVNSWDIGCRNTPILPGVGAGALELIPTVGNSYFAVGIAGGSTTLLHVKNTGIDVAGDIYIAGSSKAVGSARIGLKFQTGYNNFGSIVPYDVANSANNDATTDLGQSNVRFDDVYATNGTIQTSDQDEKQDFEALSDAEKRVAVAAKGLLKKFRWKSAVAEKGDNARIHFGIVAQELEAAFTAEGLDAGRYGMFISSTWTEDGVEKTRRGVRYHELLAFIISAL